MKRRGAMTQVERDRLCVEQGHDFHRVTVIQEDGSEAFARMCHTCLRFRVRVDGEWRWVEARDVVVKDPEVKDLSWWDRLWWKKTR